jgi:hypothetical protein
MLLKAPHARFETLANREASASPVNWSAFFSWRISHYMRKMLVRFDFESLWAVIEKL